MSPPQQHSKESLPSILGVASTLRAITVSTVKPKNSVPPHCAKSNPATGLLCSASVKSQCYNISSLPMSNSGEGKKQKVGLKKMATITYS